MSITLHQLKVFMAVADCMSVSKAAQQLHMTQPAVSNILKQLQDNFDCQLTDVVSRKLYLTPFGETLLQACHDISLRIAQAHDEINLLKGSITGLLKVACVSTAKYFTPHLLGQFKKSHPGVRINLSVHNRQGIIERLQDNVDDFAIMSHPPKQLPVEAKKFYVDQLIVAGGNHLNTNATLEQLAKEPWIAREFGSGTRYASEKVFKKIGFSPNYAFEFSDVEAVKQAIIAQMGISVISKHSIRLELDNKLLKSLNIDGFPVNHNWYFVYLKGKQLTPLAKNFFKFAKHLELSMDD